MRAMRKWLVVITLCAGCASAEQDDKGARPVPSREVVSGGGSIRGGGVRMDVQVGRPFAQKPTRSTDATAKPGAVVTK